MRVPGRRIAAGPLDAAHPARRWASGTGWPTWPGSVAVATCPAPPAADAECAVVFTSGATGPAKGVVYRHRQVQAQLDGCSATTYGLTADDRLVAAFAPFALYGPALGVASAVPDMDVTAPGTLTAAALADAVRAVDATVVFASPAALRNVVATAADLTAEQRAALGGVRLLMSAGAPVPAAAAARGAASCCRNAERAHAVRHDRGAAGDRHLAGRDRGRPGPATGSASGARSPGSSCAVEPARRPTASPTATRSPTAGRDRRDLRARPPTSRTATTGCGPPSARARATAGWHRTGDVGHLDDDGRLWVEGRLVHVVTTADGPVTPVGVEQRVEAPRRGGRGRGRRGRPGRHPAGRGRRRPGRRRAGACRRPLGRRWPSRLAAAVRAAAGRARRRRAGHRRPCRSTSGTTPRSTAPGWPAGPTGCWPAGGSDAREGPGHRRERACSAPASPGPCAARGDDVTVLQRRPLGLGPAARSSATSPTAPPCAGPSRGQDAVVHLAAKVDVTGAWADYAARQRRRAPPRSSTPAGPPASRRLVHVSSPSVAHAGSALVGAGAGPADPGPRPRALRAHQGDGRAARPGRRRAGPGRRRGPAAPGLGTRRHPAGRAGSSSAPGPAGCRSSARGAALIDTHLRRQRRRRPRRRRRPLRRGPRRGARGLQRRAAPGRRAPRRHLPRRRGAAAAPARAVRRRLGRRRRRRRGLGGPARGARRRRAGRPAADPVPRRAARHRALVRPAPHPRAAGLGARGSASTRGWPPCPGPDRDGRCPTARGDTVCA